MKHTANQKYSPINVDSIEYLWIYVNFNVDNKELGK